MNPAVLAVAQFVRDLLSYDEQLIRIGRQDFQRADFEAPNIVVDALGQAQQVACLETYDGTAEEMRHGAIWKGLVTVDFYGTGAYTRARDFTLRARSQAAAELKKALDVTIYQSRGLTDLKTLTGQQYGERVQVELMVAVSSEVVIDTMRIDIAQIAVQTETQEVEFNG